jgi:hypothetical protein
MNFADRSEESLEIFAPLFLMNISNQDLWLPVILSAAKNLSLAREILRCAQNDSLDVDR